jgi:hypothetical protein
MEILEIRSSHSLTSSIPDSRPTGAHSYQVNTHHFISMQQSWQKNGLARGLALSVLTRSFERIWITAEEVRQVLSAIQSKRSPIAIG